MFARVKYSPMFPRKPNAGISNSGIFSTEAISIKSAFILITKNEQWHMQIVQLNYSKTTKLAWCVITPLVCKTKQNTVNNIRNDNSRNFPCNDAAIVKRLFYSYALQHKNATEMSSHMPRMCSTCSHGKLCIIHH